MPRSKSKKQRRRPRQARSAETVEVILKATIQVLLKRGIERTTTSRIAERAGVSIGSLYQYFPNKQALITELIARHIAAMEELTRVTIAKLADVPLREGPGLLLEAIVAAHRVNPRLHQVFMQQLPEAATVEMRDRMHLGTEEIVSQALASHPDFPSHLDPQTTGKLLTRAGVGVIVETMRRAPEEFLSGELANEMTRMFVAYLELPPVPSNA